MSDRKFRLFACACCRRLWDVFTHERSRQLVELAEELADGLVTVEDADRRLGEIHRAGRLPLGIDEHTVSRAALLSHPAVRRAAPDLAAKLVARLGGSREEEARHQCDVIRDVVGNPFRPAVVAPSWLTTAVVGLARGIYEERAFDRLPVLADALEDAGCATPEILAHCRGPGPHVRGCWVVDAMLGKQ